MKVSGQPIWFKLLKAWQDKGKHGLTLPFLTGATAFLNGERNATRVDAEAIVREMREKPVQGFLVNLRWCGEMNDEVFEVQEVNSPYRMHDRVLEITCKQTAEVTLVLHNQVAYELNTTLDANEILNALLTASENYIVSGNFSKTSTEDGRGYGPFSEEDIAFIESATKK